MHYEAMFKGAYISAVEFQGKSPTLSVRSVQLVDIEGDDGKTKTKGVVFFTETDRGWVINKTNAQLMSAMFGPETDGWVGHKVTLHAVEVKFGGKTVPGIRVMGSPDLDRTVRATVKLPRRKPTSVNLTVTRPANTG